MTIIVLTFSSCGYENNENETEQFHFRFNTQIFGYLDTVINFIAYAETEEDFRTYTTILTREIAHLHNLFTTFEPHPNNLYMLNSGYEIEANPILVSFFEIAKEAYIISEGRLNIAIGAVTSLWQEQRNSENPIIPSLNTLYEASNNTNIEDIIIEAGKIYLNNPYMQLDVGAIAKAFTMNYAVNKLIEETGIKAFLLSVGGDVIAHGEPISPNRDAWMVGVEDPSTGAAIKAVPIINTSFFASGDYRRFFMVDGERFSHIIDPQTLFPANYFRSVNVIHEDTIMAEILTTALFLMPINLGMQMAEKYNARVLWVDLEDNIITTPNF